MPVGLYELLDLGNEALVWLQSIPSRCDDGTFNLSAGGENQLFIVRVDQFPQLIEVFGR